MKFKPEPATRKIIRNFKVLVQVLSFDDKIADLALNSDFKDFEDAIQYFTAIENNRAKEYPEIVRQLTIRR